MTLAVKVALNPNTTNQPIDPQLAQYCFLRLMIFIETRFIPLPPLSIVSTMIIMREQPVLLEEYCAECWLTELHESMYRCTGRDITEITLKTPLNTYYQSTIVSTMVMWESCKWLGKNLMQSAGQKNSMYVFRM